MKQATLDLEPPAAAPCPLCKGTGMLAEFEIIPDERVCEPIDCPRCAGMGTLEPPAATTRPRVTTSATETACAAAPAFVACPVPTPVQVGKALEAVEDSDASSRAPKRSQLPESPRSEPAGPRSKAARIVQLARALGVQSDAEAAGQLAPF